ncbi:hypothetical protein HY643_04370 [Candidatus Woesearchaeota archaeon]|nr:hypothetical protein [Candidatus Woesearchaeota archaeon]
MGGIAKKVGIGILATSLLAGTISPVKAQPTQDPLIFSVEPDHSLGAVNQDDYAQLRQFEQEKILALLSDPTVDFGIKAKTLTDFYDVSEKAKLDKSPLKRFNDHFNDYLNERMNYNYNTAYYYSAIQDRLLDKQVWGVNSQYYDELFSEAELDSIKIILSDVLEETVERTMADYPRLKDAEKRLMSLFTPRLRIRLERKSSNADNLDVLLDDKELRKEKRLEENTNALLKLGEHKTNSSSYIDIGVARLIKPYAYMRARNPPFVNFLRVKYTPIDNVVNFSVGKTFKKKLSVLAETQTRGNGFFLEDGAFFWEWKKADGDQETKGHYFDLERGSLVFLYTLDKSTFLTLSSVTDFDKEHSAILSYTMLRW